MFGIAIGLHGLRHGHRLDHGGYAGLRALVNLVNMPLFFLSGALFPLDTRSGWIQFIAFINPLSYGVDGLRGAFTSVSQHSARRGWPIVMGCVTVLFLSIRRVAVL